MPGIFGHADPLFLLLAALALEAYLGRGAWLGNILARPRAAVVAAARGLEQRLNRPQRSLAERRRRGWIVAVALVLLAGFVGWLLALFTRFYPFAWPLELLLLLLLVSQRRTWGRGGAVAAALERGGLASARTSLVRLAGGDLDPFQAERLPRSSLAPLAITAVARRLSDSLVSPVFWYVLLGPGGLALQQMSLLLARLYGGAALNESGQAAPAGAFAQGAIRISRALEWLPAQLAALLLMAARLGLPEQRTSLWAGAGRRQWPERLLATTLAPSLPEAAGLRQALGLFSRAALLQAALLVLLLFLRLLVT